MIVVTIIGIMAAAIAPGIRTTLAEGRASNAAIDLVRLGARARAESVSTGLAHLMSYCVGNQGFGGMELFRGINDRCNLQDWSTLNTSIGFIDGVWASEYNAEPTHRIQIAPTNGTRQTPWGNITQTGMNRIDICYQPDGAMLLRNQVQNRQCTVPGGVPGGLQAGNDFAESIGGDSDVEFEVQRSVGGAVQGVTRRVLFPYGGSARIER